MNHAFALILVILLLVFVGRLTALKEDYWPYWRQRIPWHRRRWGRSWWRPDNRWTYQYYPYYSYY